MGCEVNKARYISEIRTMREVREARRELELREWFARQRLAEDAVDTFSFENLLSMVAPRGSLVDRIIGGVGTGFSVVQGILGVAGSLLSRAVSQPESRVSSQPASHRRTAAQTTTRRTTRPDKKSAPKSKRTPEIEVEVELDPKPKQKRAK